MARNRDEEWLRLKARLRRAGEIAPYGWKSAMANRLGITPTEFVRYLRDGYNCQPNYSTGKEMERICRETEALYGGSDDSDELLKIRGPYQEPERRYGLEREHEQYAEREISAILNITHHK